MKTRSVMDNPQGNTVSEVGASTAGPWVYHHSFDMGDHEWSLQTDNLAFLLFNFHPSVSRKEQTDIARLIAAAPDILAELKTSACPRLSNDAPIDCDPTVEACMARGQCGCSSGDAIRKATGTTDTHRDSVTEQRAEGKVIMGLSDTRTSRETTPERRGRRR